MSRMSTLTRKKKTIIGAVAAIIILAVILLVWSPWEKDEPQDTTETSTSTTAEVNDNGIAIQTTPTKQAEETTVIEKEWSIEPKFVLYFKTEEGFADAEFTDRTFANLEDAKTITFSESIKVNGEYAEPEVRLYGVPLDAHVSVSCESIVTKAHYANIGINDGAYEYFYWQPRLYPATEQGEYTFKVCIKESEGSDAETVIYYKMAV